MIIIIDYYYWVLHLEDSSGRCSKCNLQAQYLCSVKLCTIQWAPSPNCLPQEVGYAIPGGTTKPALLYLVIQFILYYLS